MVWQVFFLYSRGFVVLTATGIFVAYVLSFKRKSPTVVVTDEFLFSIRFL